MSVNKITIFVRHFVVSCARRIFNQVHTPIVSVFVSCSVDTASFFCFVFCFSTGLVQIHYHLVTLIAKVTRKNFLLYFTTALQ